METPQHVSHFFFVANRNRSSFSRVGAQICAGVAREVSDVLKEATASALRVKALLGIQELRPTTPVVGAARQHAGAASDSDGTTDVELRTVEMAGGDGRGSRDAAPRRTCESVKRCPRDTPAGTRGRPASDKRSASLRRRGPRCSSH